MSQTTPKTRPNLTENATTVILQGALSFLSEVYQKLQVQSLNGDVMAEEIQIKASSFELKVEVNNQK